MGHQITKMSFDASTSKNEILNACREASRGTDHSQVSEVRFIEDVILNGRDEAEKYIDEHDNGWYDNLAVRYRDPYATPFKRLEHLRALLREAENKYRNLQTQPVQTTNKSKYIGCKKCGSKLASQYIHGWTCPLCHSDLRSETHQKKVESAKQRVSYLEELLSAEEKRLAAKSQHLKWLVKIEFHV